MEDIFTYRLVLICRHLHPPHQYCKPEDLHQLLVHFHPPHPALQHQDHLQSLPRRLPWTSLLPSKVDSAENGIRFSLQDRDSDPTWLINNTLR
jgi:hypothetical protein